MKNQNIRNLRSKVPDNIRLEVYKEVLDSHLSMGLCLSLPVVLWGHKNICTLAPDGKHWSYFSTPEAFPELKKDLPLLEECAEETKEGKRKELLESWIKKLTNGKRI